MLTPVGRAGLAVITPLLKGGDPNAAAANWAALNRVFQSAQRFPGAVTIELPAGTFYIGASGQSLLALDESSRGLTIRGMGSAKTILVPGPDFDVAPVGIISSRVAYFSVGNPIAGTLNITGVTDLAEAAYQENDVIYVWTENSGSERSLSQRLTVNVPSGTTVTVHETIGSFASPVRMKHVKGVALASGLIAAGSNQVTLASSGLASRLTVGDDVLIGDGPAQNNFYSEWARVLAVDSGTGDVTLDRPLRRDYATLVGSPPVRLGACIVPGPHMSDITIRGLSIAQSGGSPSDGFGTIRFGVRIRFEDVSFIPRPDATTAFGFPVLNVVNCGNSSANSRGGAALAIAACQDIEIRDTLVPSVIGTEYCSDLLFDGIQTYRPEGFQFASASGPGPCERIHLVNSRITNHGDGSSESNVNFVTGSVVSNVQIVLPNHTGTPPAIDLEDDNLILTAVTSDSAITVRGDDLRITDLSSPNGLTLASGSTGVLVTPLLPDPDAITDSSGFAWRMPLVVRTDRKLLSPSTGKSSLEVMALSGQTADLQQWQKSDASVKLRVNPNGYLVVASTSAPTGSDLNNAEASFSVDFASSKFTITAKDGSGNILTGTVGLS